MKTSDVWSVAVFFVVNLNKLRNKQSRVRWFEASWRSCDANCHNLATCGDTSISDDKVGIMGTLGSQCFYFLACWAADLWWEQPMGLILFVVSCYGQNKNGWITNRKYRKTSSIRRTKPKNFNIISSCLAIVVAQSIKLFIREWRWSWSGDDRRCSNYIWVINKIIAF